MKAHYPVAYCLPGDLRDVAPFRRPVRFLGNYQRRGAARREPGEMRDVRPAGEAYRGVR